MEIEIEDDSIVGMPFVLRSGGNWIKNQGSDFYVEFGVKSKQIQKVLSLNFLEKEFCNMLFLVLLVFLFFFAIHTTFQSY